MTTKYDILRNFAVPRILYEREAGEPNSSTTVAENSWPHHRRLRVFDSLKHFKYNVESLSTDAILSVQCPTEHYDLTFYASPVTNEREVCDNYVLTVMHLFKNNLSVAFRSSHAYVDYLVEFAHGVHKVPFVVKKVWNFGKTEGGDLVPLTAEEFRTYYRHAHYNHDTHDSVLMALAQVYGYIVDEQCFGAILSMSDYFYVILCDDFANPDSPIRISQPILCSEPEYTLKLYYLITCLSNLQGIEMSDEDEEGDEVYDERNTKRCKVEGPTSGVPQTRSAASSSAKFIFNQSRTKDTLLGRGRSGVVYKGTLEGHDAAFKLSDSSKGINRERLQRELAMYEKFKEEQGHFLPKVYHTNVTTGGNLTGFAMELLGPLPDEWSQWTPTQKSQVREVLLGLADVGLFQEDIRPENFGLNQENRVVMVDLEEVTTADEHPLDLVELRKRFKKLVRYIMTK